MSWVSLMIHGANWIIYKTNSALNSKLRDIVFKLNFVLLGLVIISLLIWNTIESEPFHNFLENPYFLRNLIKYTDLDFYKE